MMQALHLSVEAILCIALAAAPQEGRTILGGHVIPPFVDQILARSWVARPGAFVCCDRKKEAKQKNVSKRHSGELNNKPQFRALMIMNLFRPSLRL